MKQAQAAKNHVKKVKPVKKQPTRTTGISCIPSGGPPDSSVG